MGMERGRAEDESTDPAASSTLARAFELHFDAIYRYAYRRAGASVAEEIASETFARAVARAGTFDPTSGSYRQWLFGIAANVIKEYERARLRQIRQPSADSGIPPSSIDQMIDRLGDTARVDAALARLRPAAREILLLVAGSELTYEETAHVLGIPIGTVRSRLSAARDQLVKQLARVDSDASREGSASS
jgi:RNA polymerase sigma-70 factor (ECF subfamily)